VPKNVKTVLFCGSLLKRPCSNRKIWRENGPVVG
jgi:hypothetical protein